MMPICWRDYKSWCNHICSTPCQHNHHHYVKDSKLSERVQHRFTRLVSKLKKLSCGKRLEYWYLGLWILVERRNRAAYGGPGDIDKKINISYERNTNSFERINIPYKRNTNWYFVRTKYEFVRTN